MSTAERFDRADFEVSAQKRAETIDAPVLVRTTAASMSSQKPMWPILGLQVASLGDGIMPDRRGRPHEGIDLHAPAGTEVVAARAGRVLRVVDGRKSKREALHRAGLFVDVLGADALIYRYLHLGSAAATPGADIQQGDPIGIVAEAHTSGLGSRPHIHFEIRRSDGSKSGYGVAINPLRLLPKLNS